MWPTTKGFGRRNVKHISLVMSPMNGKKFFAIFALGLMLVACNQPQDQNGDMAPKHTEQPVTKLMSDVEIGPPLPNLASSQPNSADAVEPIPKLAQEAERGVKGARNFLLSFASAIEQKRYGQAWALLSPTDKQKWSRSEFNAMFADLGKTTVAIPIGTTDGAAGSLYYTAPVTIAGLTKDGRPVRIEGEAVLRRVNDVDGATSAQQRWHFETLTLAWVH